MGISEKEFRGLLDRYLSNTATPEERAIVDRFFKSYQSGLSKDVNERDPQLEQELLRETHARIRSKGQRRKNRVVRLWLSLAAALSFFVLAYFITNIRLADTRETACAVIEVKTTVGQRSVTRLPDGSIVHLNDDSNISYCGDFKEDVRRVKVRGEAYFQVVKGEKPFVVETERMQTEVLGTSFNVKNRDGETAEVTLVEGSVNVISPGGSFVLRPNQHASIELTLVPYPSAR